MDSVIAFIGNLLIGEGIFIAVAAFAVAEIVKRSLDFIPRKYIPLIGGIVGILLGILSPEIFAGDTTVVCAVKGLVLGWAATGAFETVKNTRSK